MISSEPLRKASDCSYCGDAPISHALFYPMSLFAVAFDNDMLKVTSEAPAFFRDFVEWVWSMFFETLLFFRVAHTSSLIEKANTFRSRVIWEEARRRGISMEQIFMFGRPLDQYRAKIHNKWVYFNSLPIPPRMLRFRKNWDDKFILKKEFSKKNIPVPTYVQFPAFLGRNLGKIFSKFQKPIIVKPRVGSRGRHTVTNIYTVKQFQSGVDVASKICAYLIAEEHLEGYVCRATFVNGTLMGFYRGASPTVTGDGKKTIRDLILEKDAKRQDRVEKVLVNQELEDYVLRSGFTLDDVPPDGVRLSLSHRTGRLFGGETREMLHELHPSFVPILKVAAETVGLPVIGFDCIVPDPHKEASGQRWGIIECNTLPFIDLHYYALEGKPQNIAGAIWDLWY